MLLQYCLQYYSSIVAVCNVAWEPSGKKDVDEQAPEPSPAPPVSEPDPQPGPTAVAAGGIQTQSSPKKTEPTAPAAPSKPEPKGPECPTCGIRARFPAKKLWEKNVKSEQDQIYENWYYDNMEKVNKYDELNIEILGILSQYIKGINFENILPPAVLVSMLRDFIDGLHRKTKKAELELDDLDGSDISGKIHDHSRKAMDYLSILEKQVDDSKEKIKNLNRQIDDLYTELNAAENVILELQESNNNQGGATGYDKKLVERLQQSISDSMSDNYQEEIHRLQQENQKLVEMLNGLISEKVEREEQCMRDLYEADQRKIFYRMLQDAMFSVLGYPEPNQEGAEEVIKNWYSYLVQAYERQKGTLKGLLDECQTKSRQINELASECRALEDEVGSLHFLINMNKQTISSYQEEYREMGNQRESEMRTEHAPEGSNGIRTAESPASYEASSDTPVAERTNYSKPYPDAYSFALPPESQRISPELHSRSQRISPESQGSHRIPLELSPSPQRMSPELPQGSQRISPDVSPYWWDASRGGQSGHDELVISPELSQRSQRMSPELSQGSQRMSPELSKGSQRMSPELSQGSQRSSQELSQFTPPDLPGASWNSSIETSPEDLLSAPWRSGGSWLAEKNDRRNMQPFPYELDIPSEEPFELPPGHWSPEREAYFPDREERMRRAAPRLAQSERLASDSFNESMYEPRPRFASRGGYHEDDDSFALSKREAYFPDREKRMRRAAPRLAQSERRASDSFNESMYEPRPHFASQAYHDDDDSFALSKTLSITSPGREEPIQMRVEVKPNNIVQSPSGEHVICNIDVNMHETPIYEQESMARRRRRAPKVRRWHTPPVTQSRARDRRKGTPQSIFSKHHHAIRNLFGAEKEPYNYEYNPPPARRDTIEWEYGHPPDPKQHGPRRKRRENQRPSSFQTPQETPQTVWKNLSETPMTGSDEEAEEQPQEM